MAAWRLAEMAALEAEAALAGLGQAAADPRVAEVICSAKALRAKADTMMEELLQRSGARSQPASAAPTRLP